MGPDFSTLQAFGLLKEMYSDDVYFMEHIQSSLYNFVRHASGDEVEFDGASFKVGLKLQINESYAALNDGERLPEADATKGVFANYAVKRMYSSLESTNFAATRGHKNGRPNGKYLDDLMKGTLLSFMSNLDFDMYGNGRGYRGTVTIATPGQASFSVGSSMWLRPGMKLDWWNAAMNVKRGTIKISVKSVDRMNRIVYIDSTFGAGAVPAGAIATDVLTVYGAIDVNEPTDGRYIAGLARITDNTIPLGGFTSADYAAWASIVMNASGGNPSQELLQLQFDQMYQISGMYPNRFVFSPAWKRAYLAPFFNQRRFNSNKFDTGASELSFTPVKMGEDEKRAKPGEFSMLEDKNCPVTDNYFWHDRMLCFATDYADTPHLADEDGSELRLRDGYDVLSGFYRFWANTVVFARNCTGKIYNYATPSGAL